MAPGHHEWSESNYLPVHEMSGELSDQPDMSLYITSTFRKQGNSLEMRQAKWLSIMYIRPPPRGAI